MGKRRSNDRSGSVRLPKSPLKPMQNRRSLELNENSTEARRNGVHSAATAESRHPARHVITMVLFTTLFLFVILQNDSVFSPKTSTNMNPATNSISIPPSPLSRPPPPSEIEINQPPPSVATNTNDNDNRGIVPRFLIRIKNLFAKLLVPFSWIPKRWRLSGVFPPNHFPTDIKTANDPLGSSDPVSTFRHKLKTQHPDLKKRSLLARFDVDDDVVLGNILSVLHEPDLNIGEEAFMNTLKFREEYEPFTASQALIKENKAGFVYTRKETLAGNPIVHYIPARAVSKNSAYYSRSLVYSLERAISRMERSNKYFVVIDCSNFGLSSIPSVKDIKQVSQKLQQ